MDAGKIFRIWMSLIGILFCVAEGKSENNFVLKQKKLWQQELKCHKGNGFFCLPIFACFNTHQVWNMVHI